MTLPADVPEEITDPHGLTFLFDRGAMSEKDAAVLAAGHWEGHERALARTHLRPGERVLELGACLGAVSMTIARIVGAGNLLAVEANPVALDLARRNAARNGLGIEFVQGIVRNRAHLAREAGPAQFHVAPALVSSALQPMPRGRAIAVPALALEELVARHRATVLVADIEGAEAELLAGADLGPIRKLIIETHYRKAGRAAVNAMVRDLYAQGFCIDLATSRGEVLYLHRGLEPEAG